VVSHILFILQGMGNEFVYSWFLTFALFWMLYAFLWVIHWILNFVCRRFGTLCSIFIGRYLPMKMEQTMFRNVAIQNSDSREFPRKKHTANLFMLNVDCDIRDFFVRPH